MRLISPCTIYTIWSQSTWYWSAHVRLQKGIIPSFLPFTASVIETLILLLYLALQGPSEAHQGVSSIDGSLRLVVDQIICSLMRGRNASPDTHRWSMSSACFNCITRSRSLSLSRCLHLYLSIWDKSGVRNAWEQLASPV